VINVTHVVLSLGSNIEREKNIRYAIGRIGQRFGDLEFSPVYETSAVGFDGPPFYNLVAGFHTDRPLPEIIEFLHQVETAAGRVRGPKSFDSRILDIDVILYGDENWRQRGINVPRDEIERYAYVLKPLADLYPDLVHPLTGQTAGNMWAAFESREQTLFMAEFPLSDSD
jgi:2-amino-4-hydroxy-6-hydroxymethyldihydropteridine diphosphokinase